MHLRRTPTNIYFKLEDIPGGAPNYFQDTAQVTISSEGTYSVDVPAVVGHEGGYSSFIVYVVR